MIIRYIRTNPLRTATLIVSIILLSLAITIIVYFTTRSAGELNANAQCRVPVNMDPYDPSILKFLEPAKHIVCSDRPALTYTAESAGRQLLHVDEKVVGKYNVTLQTLQCCYSVITRVNDTANNESSCVNFTLNAVLNVTVEYLYVSCIDMTKRTEVYSNVHAVVQKRLDVETPRRRLSVLLLGIDTMSRLNMIRTMPKTLAHLKANDWLEIKEYNKIGFNTISNLLAILGGTDEEETERTGCYPKVENNFDDCPYIWNDFKTAGYFTTFAEDDFYISTFNYKKGGFHKQPTDMYFRTFVTSATQKLPMVYRDGYAVCFGPSFTTDIFLQLSLDLLRTHSKSFSFVWLNNFSHYNINTPAFFDGHFLEYMKELETSGALENTLVLFLSDHGMSFGDIRKTFVGWLEERLPFFYIWIPQWFRDAHPKAYANLKAREDVLTSPYDLHLTLKEIAEDRIGEIQSGCQGCPTCRSMFSASVRDRSCEDAGIPSQWCACASQVKVSNSTDIVINATRHAVDVINGKLFSSGNDRTGICARLKLHSVIEARRKELDALFSSDEEIEKMHFKEYTIMFETRPGSAQFDVSVRFHPAEKEYEVVGMITRINSYRDERQCISERAMEVYCYCIS